jgi:hypothetical protein
MSGLIVHLVHFCPVQITKQFSILIFGIEIFVSMCYFDILICFIYENSIEKEQDS